jgi:MFS family permease
MEAMAVFLDCVLRVDLVDHLLDDAVAMLTDEVFRDSFDFFTVSLTVSKLAATFDVSKADITWGITLVLMLRSVGAIAFGIAADKWGRKWPFIINNLLFIILELLTGFMTKYLGLSLLYPCITDGVTATRVSSSSVRFSASPWAVFTGTAPPLHSRTRRRRHMEF